jgi:hypothetical protein
LLHFSCGIGAQSPDVGMSFGGGRLALRAAVVDG